MVCCSPKVIDHAAGDQHPEDGEELALREQVGLAGFPDGVGDLKSTSGPTIEKAGDLAGLLTNLEEGDVLFIDEIHRLQKTIEEYLYPGDGGFQTGHHH
jgi:hypothetical protein